MFQHGGKRENSGRKSKNSVTKSITFDPDVLERVDKYAKEKDKSRSEIVDKFCKESLDSRQK
jgi:metal-responsive CopG/Arc/MetJ family transcriptional regulator